MPPFKNLLVCRRPIFFFPSSVGRPNSDYVGFSIAILPEHAYVLMVFLTLLFACAGISYIPPNFKVIARWHSLLALRDNSITFVCVWCLSVRLSKPPTLSKISPNHGKFTPALSTTFAGVFAARGTNDGMETRRLLQYGWQRPRAALRVLGGDAGVLGLHQGPGERPLHPATAFSGSQGRGQMVRFLYGWLLMVKTPAVSCAVVFCAVGYYAGLLLECLDFGPLTFSVVFMPLNPGCLSSPVLPPTDKIRLLFLSAAVSPLTLSSVDAFFFCSHQQQHPTVTTKSRAGVCAPRDGYRRNAPVRPPL